MELQLLSVLCVLVAGSQAAVPSFCQGKDCPGFTTVSQHDGYEIRKYKPSVWLEASRDSTSSKREMFFKLFEYIKGKNDRGERLTMTTPVVGHVLLADGFTETMRFYLGECLPTFDPPKPQDSTLTIRHDPEMTYYVMPFRTDNWRDMGVWQEKANWLKAKIPAFSSVTSFCAASYGPRGMGDKYNEIWMHAAGEHSGHHH